MRLRRHEMLLPAEVTDRPGIPAPVVLAAHACLYGGAWRTDLGRFVVTVRRDGSIDCRRYGEIDYGIGLSDCGTCFAPLGRDGTSLVDWADLACDVGFYLGREDGRRNRPAAELTQQADRLRPMAPAELESAAVAYRSAYAMQRRFFTRGVAYPLLDFDAPLGRPPVHSAMGQRLLARRNELGLRQVDLAERAGATQPAVVRIEHGYRGASVRLVERLAAALGVRAGWLAFGEGPSGAVESAAAP